MSQVAPAVAVASGRLAVHRFRWNQLRKHAGKCHKPNVSLSTSTTIIANPFLPHFNTHSQRWIAPQFSLRQQAELVKRARRACLLHLLPPGLKASTEELKARTQPSFHAELEQRYPTVEWSSDHSPSHRIQGMSPIPSMYRSKKWLFKGHKWQRALAKRKARLTVRLRDMDRRIHRWRMNRVHQFKSPMANIKPASSTRLPY